jgi:hypothetical protein
LIDAIEMIITPLAPLLIYTLRRHAIIISHYFHYRHYAITPLIAIIIADIIIDYFIITPLRHLIDIAIT